MRVISLVVAVFLLLSSLEAWAGFWLAGRWFIGSRFATVSLSTIKSWMDRGIIRPTTQTAKIFVNRYGKIILLTLGLSEVIKEVERLRSSNEFCYAALGERILCHVSNIDYFYCYTGNIPYGLFTMQAEIVGGDVCGLDRSLPAYTVFRWNGDSNSWQRLPAKIPLEGRHFLGRNSQGRECYLNVSINISPCPFQATANTNSVPGHSPSQVDWNQRRQVPVRVFPRVEDFVRPDVIEGDPSLRWLRDEYNRIARDPAIPQIPADALSGLELPGIDWKIPPEEAVDSSAESSRDTPRPSTDAPPRDRPRDEDRPRDDDLPFVPGFDTSLPTPEKRLFPSDLLNTIVQSHPLLRVLQGVSLDPGGGGSCQVGSGVFTFDFCQFQWVLNLMGSVIVFVGFMTGLFWSGRSD